MSELLREVRLFRQDTKLFLLYNLLAYVGWGVFQLIFNLYLGELGLHEDAMGRFSAAQTLVMAVGAATMGPVLARFGVWRSMIGGMIVFLATSVGLALAEHPALILALSAASGAGLAYLFTTTMPFIIEWTPVRQRQHVSAVAFAVIGLSGTLGSLVGGVLPDRLPLDPLWAYRWTLLAGTVLAALALVPLMRMGESRARAGAPDHSATKEASDALGRRQVRNDMAMFIIVGGLMAIGAGMVLPFYNVFLSKLGASADEIGIVYALAGLSSATIGLTSPAIARRWGALAGVAGVRLAGVPLYALMLIWPVMPIAVLAHIVRQTTISMAWPIDSTFIADVLPPKARASVFGLRSAAWNLAYALASLVGGLIIVEHGYNPTFWSLIVFTAIPMAIFVGYYLRHPRVLAGELPSALPRRREHPPAEPEPEPAPEPMIVSDLNEIDTPQSGGAP